MGKHGGIKCYKKSCTKSENLINIELLSEFEKTSKSSVN